VPLTRDVWWDFDLYLVQKRTGGWYWLGDATGKTLVAARSYATVQACNGDGPNATYLDAYMAPGPRPHRPDLPHRAAGDPRCLTSSLA
jgi:hypothetical protein